MARWRLIKRKLHSERRVGARVPNLKPKSQRFPVNSSKTGFREGGEKP